MMRPSLSAKNKTIFYFQAPAAEDAGRVAEEADAGIDWSAFCEGRLSLQTAADR